MAFIDVEETPELNYVMKHRLRNIAIMGMNIGASETGTFDAENGAQTLPCATCVFIHEILDHISKSINDGTMKKDPDEKPGEGTKYQDRYLKERGSPTRINHDEK